MSQVNVVRAWKEEEYRQSLTEAERAALPENPTGLLDLAEPELEQVAGGAWFLIPALPFSEVHDVYLRSFRKAGGYD